MRPFVYDRPTDFAAAVQAAGAAPEAHYPRPCA